KLAAKGLGPREQILVGERNIFTRGNVLDLFFVRRRAGEAQRLGQTDIQVHALFRGRRRNTVDQQPIGVGRRLAGPGVVLREGMVRFREVASRRGRLGFVETATQVLASFRLIIVFPYLVDA